MSAVAEHASGRRLARSTAIFSAATALSRILGLVREIVTRSTFGVVGPINAFTVAFQIPNLVRALLADAALSSAFIPVFSELLQKGEKARAWRVAASILWLFLLGLTGLTALFVVLAPYLMAPFGIGGAEHDLAVELARILFPTVILLGGSGIVVGILNSYNQFTVPALTPVAWNLAIILGLVFAVPQASLESEKLKIYAASIVVATVIQFVLPLPWLLGLDGKLRLAIDWRDPAVKRVFVLMVPVTLGLGLINFNAVIDTFFAARFVDPNLAPSSIDAAFRLYMLPQGIFSVAVATVLFPTLSRFAAAGEMGGFRSTMSSGIRQIGFLLIPASVLLAVLSEPIVRLIYQHGNFTADQTPVVANALAAFALGLTFNGTMLMLNRGFFSLQEPWAATWVALGNLVLNAILDYAFSGFGVWGIPLSTSLVNIAGTAALLVLLRRRLGHVGMHDMTRTYALVLVASTVAAAAAAGLWKGLDRALGDSVGAQLAALGVATFAAIAIYVLCCRLLRVRELGTLLSLLRRRRAR